MNFRKIIQILVQIVFGLTLFSTVYGYPEKHEDHNTTKPEEKPTSPHLTTTIATKESALPTTATVLHTTIASTATTIGASNSTTLSAVQPVETTTLETTIAIKALDDVETSNVQRQKRQATIPAFPTNALPGNSNQGPPPNGASNLGPPPNGTPPTGSLPPPSGSSQPQPNIASPSTGNSAIPPSLPASPQTISAAAPLPAAGAAAGAIQPVKFPQAGK